MQLEPNDIFPTLRNRSIVIAGGYTSTLTVERHQLRIHERLGRVERERRYTRPHAPKRIVFTSPHGTLSIAAARWIADVDAELVVLSTDGRPILQGAGLGLNDGRLRLAQSFAARSALAIDVSKKLLLRKIEGEIDLLVRLPDTEEQREKMQCVHSELADANSIQECVTLEGRSAAHFWRVLEHAPVNFARWDQERIRPHWRHLGPRASAVSGGPRLACTPGQALINLTLSAATMEVAIAIRAAGLDVAVGLMHVPTRSRDSLVYDLIEPLRPLVVGFVLDLIAQRVLRARDFAEDRRGVVKVLPPLRDEIFESLPDWAALAGPIVEQLAQQLANTARIGRLPTTLTQANRSAGRDAYRRRPPSKARAVKSAPACRSCGVILETAGRGYCDTCRLEREAEVLAVFQASGPARLAELREQGIDPSRTEEARRKLGAKNRKRQEEAFDWDRKHTPPDPEIFKREILPRIQGRVSLRCLAEATGLSRHYCSQIRRGLRVPHPRFWPALRTLGERSEE